MTAVDELIAFVRAALDARERQLDEDERVAREVVGKGYADWAVHVDELNLATSVRLPNGYSLIHPDGELDLIDAEHIARWDPARVLDEVKIGRAEVEAKRRILDRYEDARARQQDPDYSQLAADEQVSEYEDWIIPALAQPYAGRPGWQEEWRA